MTSTSENAIMARQPTIHDVAAASGLSRGTVSRYLNGGKNVSPAAAALVEQAIRDTGYRVNGHARSLRSNRSDTVAFVLQQPMELLFNDPVHSILARECAAALSQHGQFMVMVIAGTDLERERAMAHILSGHVDGVLMVGSNPARPMASELAEAGIPVVVCGHGTDGALRHSSVASDSRAAFATVVRQLQADGRRHIAFLGGTSELDETGVRQEGYAVAMGAAGDPLLVAVPEGPEDEASTAELVRRLLGRAAPDALVCVNDVAAAVALQELDRAGLRSPEDVAVVGFDNVEVICEATTPRLTSVAQDFPAIAHHMVSELQRLRSGEAPRHVNVPTTMVRRDSW